MSPARLARRLALSLLLLFSAAATAAEIDIQLTTGLSAVRSVQLDALPVKPGPGSSLLLKSPSDVKTSGAERAEGMLEPLAGTIAGWYRYGLNVVLFDGDGEVLSQGDDDDDDYTPIVDIFIDTDCEDCGDYDFTVPTGSGSHPSTIRGRVDILPDGSIRWKVSTAGNRLDRPAAWAEIEIFDSLDPGAPMVFNPKAVVPLDETTLQFTGDFIFTEGEPAGLDYQVYASWLDIKGAKLGQTELFTAKAEVAKKRKDGTYVYKPWRFHSDLSEVVGESWELEAMTDTWFSAAALQYTLVPLDGGPKLDPATRTVKIPSGAEAGGLNLVGKAQARDVSLDGTLEDHHTWLFQARVIGPGGRLLTENRARLYSVAGTRLAADGSGESCQGHEVPCLEALTIRYSDTLDENAPTAVWVTAPRIVTEQLAETLELTLIADESNGPMLTQAGQKPGFLKLPIDTRRMFIDSTLNLLFAPGTPDQPYRYEMRTGWLSGEGKLLEPEESGSLQLEPRGDGWRWVELIPNATVKIKG